MKVLEPHFGNYWSHSGAQNVSKNLPNMHPKNYPKFDHVLCVRNGFPFGGRIFNINQHKHDFLEVPPRGSKEGNEQAYIPSRDACAGKKEGKFSWHAVGQRLGEFSLF